MTHPLTKKLYAEPAATAYLRHRRVSADAIEAFQIGYETDRTSKLCGRVVMPIRDYAGTWLAWQGRALDPGVTPKYWHSSYDKSGHLYGLFESGERMVRQGYAVLVEGNFDVIALWDAGYPGVATMGAALTDRQCELLLSFTDRVVVLSDAGERGGIIADSAHNKLLAYGFTVAAHHLWGCDASEAWRVDPKRIDRAVHNALESL